VSGGVLMGCGLYRKHDIDDAVRNRDLDYLATLLRYSSQLDPEVREHLVDVVVGCLTGKIKFPRRRPKKATAEDELRAITARVASLEAMPGWQKRGAVVEQVATEFKISPRKVWSCLKEIERRNAWERAVREREERWERGEFTQEEMDHAADMAADLIADGYPLFGDDLEECDDCK
jgi:hypothetical protein